MSYASLVCVFLATVLVSSTVAIAPCSDVILAGLSTYAQCYTTGQPPTVAATANALATHLVASQGEIPVDVTCVTGSQDLTHTYANFDYPDKVVNNTWNAVFYSNYFEESQDGLETKYRVYVIHNESGAYSYYRCIQEGGEGTGTHAVHVAVGCAYINNNVTLAVVDKAEQCFNKLHITNYVTLRPCVC